MVMRLEGVQSTHVYMEKEASRGVFMAIFIILNILFSLCTNGLLFYVFVKRPKHILRDLPMQLVFCIVISNLVLSIVCMPMSVLVCIWSGGDNWVFSETLCTVHGLTNTTCQLNLLWLITSVAIDRLLAITCPIFHSTTITKRTSIAMTATLSACSLALTLLWLFEHTKHNSYDFDIKQAGCAANIHANLDRRSSNILAFSAIGAPIIILNTSFVLIIISTLIYEQKITTKEIRLSENEDLEFNFLSSNQAAQSRKNLKKIRKSSLILILFFDIFLAPFYISTAKWLNMHSHAVLVLFNLGVTISPIIYGYMNKTTRMAMQKCMHYFMQDPKYFGADDDSDTRSIGGWVAPDRHFERYEETSLSRHHGLNSRSGDFFSGSTSFGNSRQISDAFLRAESPDGHRVLILKQMGQVVKLPTEASLVTLATTIENDEEVLTAIIEAPRENPELIPEDFDLVETSDEMQHDQISSDSDQNSSRADDQVFVPLALQDDYEKYSFASIDDKNSIC